jgi:trans-aconitate methyltransferase
MSQADLDWPALAASTRGVYVRHAARFDAERPRHLHERVWLERFAARMPENAMVLDLGCGAGEPIAGWLVQAGFRLIGIDAAAPMLAIARRRYPDGDWRQADMRSLDLPERCHGIIGWSSFFHLRPDEQRATLRRLAAHLLPRGALMLTVGPQAGEVTGTVAGEPVYHSSLTPEAYEAILAAAGLDMVQLVKEDPECDRHTILLAQMRA